MTATGYANDDVVVSVEGQSGVVDLDADDLDAAPDLLVVSEPGTRWYLTDDPFNATLTAQLDVGDRFTYPAGHASARETYRWDGATWQLEQVIDAIPAAATAVVVAAVHDHDGDYTAFAAPVLGTGVTQRADCATVGSRSEPGDVTRLRGAIDIAGNPSSGTVLLTLAARDRPTGAVVHPGIRTGPTGNISAVLLISAAGEVTLTAAPGNGAYLGLDGITFVKTVA